MLEKIGSKYYEKLSLPNHLFLEYIEKLKAVSTTITIAEIGVGIGATAQEALQALDSNDQYYLFDYSDKVEELYAELNRGIPCTPKIIGLGNSRSTFDNYVWSLYSLVADKDRGDKALFDLVLLDGAHDYTIDLAACALLVDLLKPNGFLILDDMHLSIKTIMCHNPFKEYELRRIYSSSQANAFQMKMVCESFLDRQPNLQRVSTEDNTIAIYRKK